MKQVTISLHQDTNVYSLRITDSFTAYMKIVAVTLALVGGISLLHANVVSDSLKASREMFGRTYLTKEAQTQTEQRSLRVGRTIIPERFFTATSE